MHEINIIYAIFLANVGNLSWLYNSRSTINNWRKLEVLFWPHFKYASTRTILYILSDHIIRDSWKKDHLGLCGRVWSLFGEHPRFWEERPLGIMWQSVIFIWGTPTILGRETTRDYVAECDLYWENTRDSGKRDHSGLHVF